MSKEIESRMSDDSGMSINIGLVGPSGSGKTSLLTAIFLETRDQLERSKNAMGIWCSDDPTKNALERAKAEFQACVCSPDGIFEVPQMAGSDKITNYRFSFILSADPSTSGEETSPQKVKIDIMDYPGGYVGKEAFAEQVMPHLIKSVALLVPVSADMLVAWKESQGSSFPRMKIKNTEAYKALAVDSVCKIARDWLQAKSDRNEPGVLIFVPIKCEKWFSDNGGLIDDSKKIVHTVSELYVDDAMKKIAAKASKSISILCFPVDTYGIVEFQRGHLEKRPNGEYNLKSQFQRRLGMGNVIRPCNASEVLIEVVRAYMEDYASRLDISINKLKQILDNRSWLYDTMKTFLEKIWIRDPQKKQLFEQLKQYDCTFKALRDLETTYQKRSQRQFIMVYGKAGNNKTE